MITEKSGALCPVFNETSLIISIQSHKKKKSEVTTKTKPAEWNYINNNKIIITASFHFLRSEFNVQQQEQRMLWKNPKNIENET